MTNLFQVSTTLLANDVILQKDKTNITLSKYVKVSLNEAHGTACSTLKPLFYDGPVAKTLPK